MNTDKNVSSNDSFVDLELRPERFFAARRQLVDVAAKRSIWKFAGHKPQIAAGAGGLLIITATAFTVLSTKTVVNHAEYHCRAGDQENSLDISALAGTSDPGAAANFGDARDACASMWSQGILVLNATAANVVTGNVTDTHPVPDLTICVNSDGEAVVIPSKNPGICGALALATEK